MNMDLRLNLGFWDHPKTLKLARRLGLEGVRSLQVLWIWAAKNRPDGDLAGMDTEDVEIAARWEGEPGAFVSALRDLRWVDEDPDGPGGLRLHDWAENNPWVAESRDRSDAARLSRLAQVAPLEAEAFRGQGRTGISASEYAEAVRASRAGARRSPGVRRAFASEPPAERRRGAGSALALLCSSPEPKTLEPKTQNQEASSPGQEAPRETGSLLEGEIPQGKNLPETVVELWNREMGEIGFPRVLKLTQERRRKILARAREAPKRMDPGWWSVLFSAVRLDDFYSGRTGKWQADFDWLIRSEGNVTKALERADRAYRTREDRCPFEALPGGEGIGVEASG